MAGWHLHYHTTVGQEFALPYTFLPWCFLWLFSTSFLQFISSLFPVVQMYVHQAVSNSCSLDAAASWSSRKTGQLGSILSGLVFFQRCWALFKCVHGYCWHLVLLQGRAGNLKVSRLVKVTHDVAFKGELRTVNICCSLMCCVAVQVCQQTLCIWNFCCWIWLPTPLVCLQHILPSLVWVFVVQLNERQNESLSQFRRYVHLSMFGFVTLGFWPQLNLKVGKSKCLNLWKSPNKEDATV